ncbi:hypothetical protein QFC19_001980 [Naganishia cerealis]|uniref:Uncharacterized protein n=1 Tax=Naganishia cerealis TaxID=610337 RepID=A0ACC2WDC0_9TREE|nr:hypothetical protein QFC19_001980 [Naganishia cerealis]
MPVYDMQPSYLPLIQQITANGKHPISTALPPQRVLQASDVPNDFPINMDGLDMAFVFSGNHIPGPRPKHQNSTTPVVTALSVDGLRETSVQTIATGPSFSGFFSSPDAALDAGLHSNSASIRPNEVGPNGSQSALDHQVSSKPRRLSTSTTDSAKKDKDKESKQEKLALKDTRSFVVNAGMHNESDALQILAMAAETQNPKKRKRDYSASINSPNMELNEKRDGDREVPGSNGPGKKTEDELAEANSSGRFNKPRRRTPPNNIEGDNFTGTSRVTFRESSSPEKELSPTPVPDITQFFLVEQGILDPEQVHSLTRTFFTKHHHYFVSTRFKADD